MPHFAIPGFERLPMDRRQRYLQVPPEHLDRVRPIIEGEIAQTKAKRAERAAGQAEVGAGRSERARAHARETQAKEAIETFHRAQEGDEDAKKDLKDQKKELLGEKPGDDELFATIIESESTDPFAQDLAMEVLLSDPSGKAAQKVLDLFQDFRGDLPSADDALRPDRQLELFLELTKGQGTVDERHAFVRRTLEIITEDGGRNLFEGLNTWELVKDGELNEPAIKDLNEHARERIQREEAGTAPKLAGADYFPEKTA